MKQRLFRTSLRLRMSTAIRCCILLPPLLLLLTTSVALGHSIEVGQFSSNAGLISFDNLAGGSSIFTGEIVTSQYSSLGVMFVNPDYVSRANANLAAQMDGQSDPNILFIQQHDGEPRGRPQQILFSTPMLRVGTFFQTSLNSTITMVAYSPDNTFLDRITLSGAFDSPDLLT